MGEPEVSFGKGVVLKGQDAIRAAGWTIRFYIVIRALAVLLAVLLAGAALKHIGPIWHWLIG
jgi:hypothetical protein